MKFGYGEYVGKTQPGPLEPINDTMRLRLLVSEIRRARAKRATLVEREQQLTPTRLPPVVDVLRYLREGGK